MKNKYYIASCIFTARFPELSYRIAEYVKNAYSIEVLRCCIPGYKVQKHIDDIREGNCRDFWKKLPDSAAFSAEDEIYSICHNCSNIIEEMNEGTRVRSIWELILSDPDFAYPDHSGEIVTVQDCWRTRDRKDEQDAVREILKKMHFQIYETDKNHEETDFCGSSLYRAQPPRNPKLAPKHYLIGAEDKFIPHTEEVVSSNL